MPRGLFVNGILGGLTQVASAASFGATINHGDSLYFVCEFDEGMVYFDTSLGKLVSFQATVEYTNAQGKRRVSRSDRQDSGWSESSTIPCPQPAR